MVITNFRQWLDRHLKFVHYLHRLKLVEKSTQELFNHLFNDRDNQSSFSITLDADILVISVINMTERDHHASYEVECYCSCN